MRISNFFVRFLQISNFLYAFCESQIFYKIEKSIKIIVAIFDQMWNENWFATTKFALSEPLRTLKPKKIDRQQYYVDKPIRKSKNILTILIFFLCRGTLLTSPIDRSRSQLFRTFFLASWRFLYRPKRPLLFFCQFWAITKKIQKTQKKFEKRKRALLALEKNNLENAKKNLKHFLKIWDSLEYLDNPVL